MLTGNTAYGKTGVRDKHLEMSGLKIGGRVGSLHFIRFPTSEMNAFIELARSKNFPSLAKSICATGGGACKFESHFKSVSICFVIIARILFQIKELPYIILLY